ncbi:AGAP000273-PA-like protein [Anopheles sinensis]|uniref:AGAP000273-PA-like protein n=1 Tax=Anopheles sinensis TaxID=74873 RepID=A0A084VNW0_ANOSI|nr:AGAP000273-PA-like protein [Anopheles sinensis]
MENQDERPEEGKKSVSAVIKQDQNLIAIVNSLLDSLNDKDELLRSTTEASLIRIAKRRHDEIVEVLCEYRKKHPKLGDTHTLIILRVISYIGANLIDVIDPNTASKCIQYSTTEITKNTDQNAAIQNPCREILVAVGRRYCKEIMEIFVKHLEENQLGNFMIMQSIGALATANVRDTVPYVKAILGLILPTLAIIKQDFLRQAYAYAIGRFCEAFSEYQEYQRQNPNTDEIPMTTVVRYEIHDEISIIYDHFHAQWLSSREPKVTGEVLNAFSFMYPLLPVEKVSDQLPKTLSLVMALYRKSLDRSAITQYLASIIKTVLQLNSKLLAPTSDNLIVCLFDLVCVNPDYDKPQTVKGHFEVLRCFDLLAPEYGEKIIEILIIHLRNNNERERIKSLLVVTHLTNTSEQVVHDKLPEIIGILKGMLATEKPIKVKIVLLKTVVAFMQKNFVQDREFVTFLIRSSCRPAKLNLDHGTLDEHQEFQRACNDTMHILSSTVGTVDAMLKLELLQAYLRYEYTDICGTIGKCLANLFTKDPELTVTLCERHNPFDENVQATEEVPPPPRPVAVFVRTLALLGNYSEQGRIQHLLTFLRSYAGCLYRQLVPLWLERTTALQTELASGIDERRYYELLFQFLQATIKDVDEYKFVESIIAEMFHQLPLYQAPGMVGSGGPSSGAQTLEFRVPSLEQEKRMVVKVFGVCLCHSLDEHLIANKIDLIVTMAKGERCEKNAPPEEFERLMQDYADALGYASVEHLDKVMAKLTALVIDEGAVKKSSSFFSNLNFIKDSAREQEAYRLKVLALQALHVIISRAPREKVAQYYTDQVVRYLIVQFDSKELFIKQLVVSTLLALTDVFSPSDGDERMTSLRNKNDLHRICMATTTDHQSNEYLPLFPSIIQLATVLVQLNAEEQPGLDVNGLLNSICFYFFTTAQNLKSRFDSAEDDTRNSYLARFLNLSLPEVNRFIRTLLVQQNASPACLDDVHSILEKWLKDRNSEVRICACHVYNSTLEVYMKSMKIGCEAPSKFNQTGSMLGKIIPRCIDSNATVRQTAVEVLKKILEIACVYETLTVADSSVQWVAELDRIHEEIVTDDAKDIYRIASELAQIIAQRLSNYQYVQFSKCLLYGVADPEPSSVIGASYVLKFFMHVKGSEMFHAIPELVKECLYAVKICEVPRAKTTILKSILALTKHHPKLVCNEILSQCLPLEEHVVEYWKTLTMDPDLSGTILDNFIVAVTSSCLYEQPQQQQQDTPDTTDDTTRTATMHPFAIVCVLKEMFKCDELKAEMRARFAEIFCMLLSTLASYITLLPPYSVLAQPNVAGNVTIPKSARRAKGQLAQGPGKETIAKLNPCQTILDAFQTFLDTLDMQQISIVLSVCPDLAASTDLNSFIEILTPLGVATASEVGINSALMRQLVTTMSRYVSSPYDTQRIASTGFYAHLVPLQPCGETASVIMLSLESSLNDPNPLVRGLSIRGMAYVCSLTQHDIDKYATMCLTSLLKGIEDYNKNCFINIPLDSMRGLSKILQTIEPAKFEPFQVSSAIRIRPFFEKNSTELRESAILLFGDVCGLKVKQMVVASNDSNSANGGADDTLVSESLMEQLKANFCSLLLHLCEQSSMIARACKITLKNICAVLGTPKMNALAQNCLIEHGQLQYNNFLKSFVKLIGEELQECVNDFIDACLPLLRSQWPEIRGNAAILIGLLHCQNATVKCQHMEQIGHKISLLLKDDCMSVKVSASEALGYIYGEL